MTESRYRWTTAHKFAVGQKVRFRPEWRQLHNPGETFVVDAPIT